jgi:hypothetical protein
MKCIHILKATLKNVAAQKTKKEELRCSQDGFYWNRFLNWFHNNRYNFNYFQIKEQRYNDAIQVLTNILETNQPVSSNAWFKYIVQCKQKNPIKLFQKTLNYALHAGMFRELLWNTCFICHCVLRITDGKGNIVGHLNVTDALSYMQHYLKLF